MNERIAHLYEPTHPAVLRLLKMIADAAHANNIWVGVCGEMAGDIALVPLLLGSRHGRAQHGCDPGAESKARRAESGHSGMRAAGGGNVQARYRVRKFWRVASNWRTNATVICWVEAMKR